MDKVIVYLFITRSVNPAYVRVYSIDGKHFHFMYNLVLNCRFDIELKWVSLVAQTCSDGIVSSRQQRRNDKKYLEGCSLTFLGKDSKLFLRVY